MERRVICVMSRCDGDAIGLDNDLIVKSSYDLKNFKSITTDGFLVMGRATCDSLPFKLPNRHSHVVSTNPKYTSDKCDSVSSLDMDHIRKQADKYYGKNTEGDIFLIGGAGLIDSMRGEVDEVIETYFNSVVVSKKHGKLTRMKPFPVKEVFSMERFLDTDAVLVHTGRKITGGVSGRIMHFRVR